MPIQKKQIIYLVILFLMFQRLNADAQNMVPNGGFEFFEQLPTNEAMIDKATYWKTNIKKLGADYFHVDSYTSKYDNKNPFKGEGYAGIFVLQTWSFSEENNSEYISTILNSKLIKNHKYYIEFYVYISYLTNLYDHSVNNISAVFTTESIEGLNNKKIEEVIKKSGTRFDNKSVNISIKNKWIKIYGNFTAKGSEEYMTIGNFDLLEDIIYVRTDRKSKKLNLDKLPDIKSLYFFIDEIKVIPVDSNGNEIKWRKDSVEITSNFVKNKPYQINNIHFETGSSLLQESSFIALDSLFNQLNRSTSAKDSIIISGHTDSEGDKEDNLKLSENRAKAVADYLIKKGIAKDKITYVGYGSSKPIADNETEQGKEQNRRVELFIKKEMK